MIIGIEVVAYATQQQKKKYIYIYIIAFQNIPEQAIFIASR